MTITDMLAIAGSLLLSLGGGAVIVFALAKWLGGVWANRILENERAQRAREQELLIRRRDVYTKLATSLRVFLQRFERGLAADAPEKFLAAYDEASVWAPDSVMNRVGELIDINTTMKSRSDAFTPEQQRAAFAACIEAMGRDAGFADTTFNYRVINF
jgi:hypothetical protein